MIGLLSEVILPLCFSWGEGEYPLGLTGLSISCSLSKICFEKEIVDWIHHRIHHKSFHSGVVYIPVRKFHNKNAFQWDAYHPLVDRIPACTVAEGVYLPEGRGVPAQGWGVPAQVLPPPVDRQTPVKTQPSQTSFAGGN